MTSRKSDKPKNNFTQYLNMLQQKYPLNNKVLFVQSFQFNFSSFNVEIAKNKGYYAFPPTNLQWLTKSISDLNLEVELLDLNYEFLRRVNGNDCFDYRNWLLILDEHIKRFAPSVIGVSCTSVSNLFSYDHPFIHILKYLRNKDEHIILTGGVNATESYRELLEKELCHFVFRGESENKIRFFFSSLLDGSSKTVSTPGIFFQIKERIEETKGETDVVKLKGNLIGTYNKTHLEEYHKVGSLNPYSRMVKERKYAAIQLNRGCRANCVFCGVTSFMGKSVRHFPVKDVVEEITYLVTKHNIKHFEWLDDDLLFNRKEISELLQEIIKRDLKITWAANNGLVAASINEELLTLFRDSGCIGFKIGIESGNPEILRKIKKPASLPLLRRLSAMLQKFPELFVGGSYIIGFPNETFGQILDTFRFSCEVNLDWTSISICQFQSFDNLSSMTTKKNKENPSIDFIPVKENEKGELHPDKDVLSGPDIFTMAKDGVPSRSQLKEIWFALNLSGNYINNKHLKPGGNPKNLISWLDAIQITYPNNPYMHLFNSLAHVLINNMSLAKIQAEKGKQIVQNSEYWQYRFKQFELDKIMSAFPESSKEVYENLEALRKKYLPLGQ